MFLSDFSIKQPVTTVAIVIVLMCLGLLALKNLRVNQIPDVDQPVMVVNFPYPGASPETVEREIVNRVEKALQSIPQVYEIRSTSSEGNARIVIIGVGSDEGPLHNYGGIIGKNITKFDTRRLATLAFLVFALVLWMRSHFSTLSDFNTMMIPTLIQGIALALFFIPLTSIILGGLPGDKIASASGLSSFCRVLFGSFGTSISVTVWQDRTTLHHAQLTEMINRGSTASNSALAGLNASGLSTEQALSQINRMIDQQAATLAANDVFYASAVIFVLLIPLVWLSRPTKGGAGASEAAAGAH